LMLDLTFTAVALSFGAVVFVADFFGFVISGAPPARPLCDAHCTQRAKRVFGFARRGRLVTPARRPRAHVGDARRQRDGPARSGPPRGADLMRAAPPRRGFTLPRRRARAARSTRAPGCVGASAGAGAA
jgi:hypothetical protein